MQTGVQTGGSDSTGSPDQETAPMGASHQSLAAAGLAAALPQGTQARTVLIDNQQGAAAHWFLTVHTSKYDSC